MGKFEDMIKETYGSLDEVINTDPDTDKIVDSEEKGMIDSAAAKGDPKAKKVKDGLEKETEKAIKDGENSLKK